MLPKLEIPKESFDNLEVIDFRARAASKEGKVAINKEVYVFFLTDDFMFYWKPGMTKVKHMIDTDAVKFDANDDENFYVGKFIKKANTQENLTW